MMFRFLFTILFSCKLLCLTGNAAISVGKDMQPSWKPASYDVLSGHKTFSASRFANVFSNGKNSIVNLAPELVGLKGVRFPVTKEGLLDTLTISLQFSSNSRLLIGVFRDSANQHANPLASIKIGKTRPDLQPILINAMSVTGMPSVDVYAIHLAKGSHIIKYAGGKPWIIVGVTSSRQKLITRNAELPDGRLWDPFIVEGFYDENPLFEIIGGPDSPVIDEGMLGTEGIQGGFEGGAIVKIGNTYHMFPTERAGERGIDAYYDRVKTRIGHWTSFDARTWKRESTIYQASGVYAITDDDNPVNERRAAIWSYMPVFNKTKNRWFGYYLTYTVHKKIEPNHSFGRIWQTQSKKDGIEGIGGPYDEGKLIMEPGLNTQLWEGRQGVASFFPYPVKDHWLGFYAGAYPYLKREDYPAKSGKGWFVGLAKADSLEGPWTRLDTMVNPVKTIHPWFVENPIVYQMPNGLYIAIFDGGPEGWGHYLPNMIGYTTSRDGYVWAEARYLPIESKVKKWWKIMRTPLCLIPERDNEFTIVYAAITENRFHPIGMVKVKMNVEVLDARLKE